MISINRKHVTATIIWTVLSASNIHAAPPPVTITQPIQVEVVKPVTVQGTIETLDESLHETVLARLPLTGDIKLVIPAGKRLVIESISYSVDSDSTSIFEVNLVITGNTDASIRLPRQETVTFFNPTPRLKINSVLALPLRIDSTKNGSVFFDLRQLGSTPLGLVSGEGLISGYFVDM
jgi:hypothetical protein